MIALAAINLIAASVWFALAGLYFEMDRRGSALAHYLAGWFPVALALLLLTGVVR